MHALFFAAGEATAASGDTPTTAVVIAVISAVGGLFAAIVAGVSAVIQRRNPTEAFSLLTDQLQEQLEEETRRRKKAERDLSDCREELETERSARRFAEREADKLRRLLNGRE